MFEDPFSYHADEFVYGADGAEVGAPGAFDEEGGNQNDAEQNELRGRADQGEKGAEDFVAGQARAAEKQGNENGKPDHAAPQPGKGVPIAPGGVVFCAADGAHALLCRAKGTEPLAVGIFIIDGEDEDYSANHQVPVDVALPLGPEAQQGLIDHRKGERFVVHETQHDHAR